MTGTMLVRADATMAIGSRHVMRCLALAQGWQDAGGDVTLAAASLGDALRDDWGRGCSSSMTMDTPSTTRPISC